MFEGLTEKGFKELEKHEIEFHYKLALKTLMRVNCFFYIKNAKFKNIRKLRKNVMKLSATLPEAPQNPTNPSERTRNTKENLNSMPQTLFIPT